MKSQRIFRLIFCIGVLLSLIAVSLAHAGHSHESHEHEHDHQHDHEHEHESEHEHDHDHEHESEHEHNHDHDAEEYNKHINQAVTVLGYDKLETITKEQFRSFFEKLVFMDDEVDDEERILMEKIYEKLSADVPEVIETKDIIQYVGIDKIYGIINEITESLGNRTESDIDQLAKDLEEEQKFDL